MKQQLWTLILFFILTTLARADDSIVMRVDSFQSVKQSIATARIADKYPITMGLKFDEIRCYDNVGFVTGWYIYDKHQQKIPLIGLYHHGFFDLFQFPPKRHAALMQALRDKTLQTEDLETAQEYLERLEVTHPWTAPDGRVTDRSGSWSNGDKTLAITQFEWKAQFAPENNFELVIEKANRNPHRLDLLEAIGQTGEYRITNGNLACAFLKLSLTQIAPTKAGWNVLLSFSRESRRCSGDDGGYFSLKLDHSYRIVARNGYITYICDKRGAGRDESGADARGQRYTVVEGQYETPRNPRMIGSFFIKNAAIKVETPWPDMTP